MTIEEILFDQMKRSYQDKIAELPPPPPGYYYGWDDFNIIHEGDNYTVECDLILKPIIDK